MRECDDSPTATAKNYHCMWKRTRKKKEIERIYSKRKLNPLDKSNKKTKTKQKQKAVTNNACLDIGTT